MLRQAALRPHPRAGHGRRARPPRADPGYQAGLLRFLENHDEPRIASRLPVGAQKAAAVAVATLPGATLWHEGQFEGRQVRPPVFLSRRPDETPDSDLGDWYHHLLATVAEHNVRSGDWRPFETTGWPDNQSHRNLLAWSWSGRDTRHVIVVNLSCQPAQARIRMDWTDLRATSHRLTDLLHDTVFERDGAELVDQGLYVALEPWQSHVFALG